MFRNPTLYDRIDEMMADLSAEFHSAEIGPIELSFSKGNILVSDLPRDGFEALTEDHPFYDELKSLDLNMLYVKDGTPSIESVHMNLDGNLELVFTDKNMKTVSIDSESPTSIETEESDMINLDVSISPFNYQLESAIKGIAFAPNPPFNTYGQALGNIEISIEETSYVLTTRPQDGFKELTDLNFHELSFLADFMTRTNTRVFYQCTVHEARSWDREETPPEEFQVSITNLTEAMAMPEFPKYDDRVDVLQYAVDTKLELIDGELYIYCLLSSRDILGTYKPKKLLREELNAVGQAAVIRNIFEIDCPNESFEFYRIEPTGDLVVTVGEDITIAVNTLNADTVKTLLSLRRCPIRTMEVDVEKL